MREKKHNLWKNFRDMKNSHERKARGTSYAPFALKYLKNNILLDISVKESNVLVKRFITLIYRNYKCILAW